MVLGGDLNFGVEFDSFYVQRGDNGKGKIKSQSTMLCEDCL